jgi:hypothetical protein
MVTQTHWILNILYSKKNEVNNNKWWIQHILDVLCIKNIHWHGVLLMLLSTTNHVLFAAGIKKVQGISSHQCVKLVLLKPRPEWYLVHEEIEIGQGLQLYSFWIEQLIGAQSQDISANSGYVDTEWVVHRIICCRIRKYATLFSKKCTSLMFSCHLRFKMYMCWVNFYITLFILCISFLWRKMHTCMYVSSVTPPPPPITRSLHEQKGYCTQTELRSVKRKHNIRFSSLPHFIGSHCPITCDAGQWSTVVSRLLKWRTKTHKTPDNFLSR